MRRATLAGYRRLAKRVFLSTLSLRRATGSYSSVQRNTKISIHALLAESDRSAGPWQGVYRDFYPRSPCGERLDDILAGVNELLISIHALLAESDNNINNSVSTADKDFYPRSPCGERPNFSCLPIELSHISIHALLAESDCCARCHCWGLNEFLSTLSLRRATGRVETAITSIGFLSTLSLRRATPEKSESLTTYLISIHALLAESDGKSNKPTGQKLVFLSTLSLRRATNPSYAALDGASISIHALLAESDLGQSIILRLVILFLSTLSLRRATQIKQTYRAKISISIHALLAESDDYYGL